MAYNVIWVVAGNQVRTAVEGFWALGHIAKGDIRHSENATFFLDGAAVTQGAECTLFQFYKIKESKGFHETETRLVCIDTERLDLVASPWMGRYDDRVTVFRVQTGEALNKVLKP